MIARPLRNIVSLIFSHSCLQGRSFAQTESDLHQDHLEGSFETGGTTALVMIHTPTTLHIANLGDYRAVLGKTASGVHHTVDLTQDHRSKAEQERGARRLRGLGTFRGDEGWGQVGSGEGVDFDRLGISKALGGFEMTGVLLLMLCSNAST